MKRHPIFARFYERLSLATDKLEREYRAEVAGGAHGRVLELGAGNGLNFEHYRDASLVVALEPEPGMMRNAVPRAAAAPVRVVVIRAAGEALPFKDGSFDTVVSSLVLCSVRDPSRVAMEVRRVLKPGGEVRLFEHVRSREPRAGRWQDRVERPWGWFAGGCHPNRQTARTLERAGFRVDVRRFPLGPPTPARPHVIGTATAP
jgi:SAM-dependent methyltransferase